MTGREPLVGELEREPGVLVGLDHARRCQRDRAVVAPPAAAGALEVVLLAAAHGEDHERELVERGLGDRLLHERDALAGGAGRGARAGRGGAERHVHAFDLGVGLDHHAADRLERAA